MFAKRVVSLAKFAPDKMDKRAVMQGESLFVGLNSFEPGQEHAAHTHSGQDKLYFVLEGSGVVRIGEDTARLNAGDATFAPSGIVHSIQNPAPDRW
jgi:quercetin dioxygenase-like cupin family protein